MRRTPPEWGPDLYRGDMWAAVRVATRELLAWNVLPAGETWADQGDELWLEDTGPILGMSPIGGSIRKDWSGPAMRTSGTVELAPADAAGVTQGEWLAIVAYLTTPAQAPAAGDPTGVPACIVADLFVTGLDASTDARDDRVTVTLEDLVTLLGARTLDLGTGPTGYHPTGRTVVDVIRELVTRFGPAGVVVVDDGAPNPAWAPTRDPDTGQPEPLTGSVWAALEELANTAGLTVHADGSVLHLGAGHANPAHTGLTITADPTYPGVQAVRAQPSHAPAPTRVIATGRDAAGAEVVGRAHDPAALAAQGFDWDAEVSLSGIVTPTGAALAAVARLDYLRDQQQAGTVGTPWLPILEPGDVVTVAWSDRPMDAHYIADVIIPLDPREGMTAALRGRSTWPTWADEPHNDTWADLDPGLTWAADTRKATT